MRFIQTGLLAQHGVVRFQSDILSVDADLVSALHSSDCYVQCSSLLSFISLFCVRWRFVVRPCIYKDQNTCVWGGHSALGGGGPLYSHRLAFHTAFWYPLVA